MKTIYYKHECNNSYLQLRQIEEKPSLEDEFELKDGKYVSIMDYDLCSLG